MTSFGNRLAILAAAREIFETGADAPMYEIGRRAGVGQATLYRHFPDMGTLAAAIAEEMIDELETEAAELGQGPETFTRLLQRMVDIVARSRGLIVLMREARSDTPLLNDVIRRLLALFITPLDLAQSAGIVSRDFRLEEVRIVINMVQGALDTPEIDQNERTAIAQRTFEIIVRGIAPSDSLPRPNEGSSLGRSAEAAALSRSSRASVPRSPGRKQARPHRP